MGLLDTLRSNLQTRITSDKKLDFNATDLGGNATIFTSLANTSIIQFTNAAVNDTGSPLLVTGQASVWQLPATTPVVISITEISGVLQFILKPQSSLSSWKFSDSFSSLGGTYLDNLELSQIWLIASSIQSPNTEPFITLNPGLNFQALTTPTQALQSIAALNSNIQNILLQGMLTKSGDKYKVNLSATLDQPVSLNLQNNVLKLNRVFSNSVPVETAEVSTTWSGNNFDFPVDIALPALLDVLAQLEITLKRRLSNGNLVFLSTDLGETTGQIFTDSVFTQELSLTGAAINKVSGSLIVTGQTSIYNIPGQLIELKISEISTGILDFTLSLTNMPAGWKPSASFAQLAGSVLDALTLSAKALTATSYSHTETGAAYSLKQGLNLYIESPVQNGPLNVITNLQPGISSIALTGKIRKELNNYSIKLRSSSLAASMPVKPVGLPAMQLNAPVLNLTSTGDNLGVITNSAFISGSLKASETLTFDSILTLPARLEGDWNLTFDRGNSVTIPSVTDVIKLGAGNNALALFPSTFQVLNNLDVSAWEIQFDQAQSDSTYYYSAVALKPAEDNKSRTWQILTSPNLSVGNFQFGLGTSFFSSDLNPAPYGILANVSGEIAIGTKTSLLASLAIPLEGDWQLAVTSDNALLPGLSDLSSFIWPQGDHTQQDLLNPLPSGLTNNQLAFILKEINVAFNPFTPSLSSVNFQLSQDGIWQILPVFNVSGWSVDMTVNVANNYAISGLLHGFMQIGSVAEIEATLPIPAGETGWTIALKEGTTIDFPGFGELLKLIGGNSIANGLPQSFNTFGSFSLDKLSVNFSPSPAAVNSFSFSLNGSQDWVVLQNYLSLSDVHADLTIEKTTGGYNSQGNFNGFVNIFNNQIWVQAVKDNFTSPWIFRIAIEQAIHLPGLAQLAAWMLPGKMATYIPDSLMPFGAGFDLTALDINFDLTSQQLNKINFSIVNSEPWDALPGYVSLDNAVLSSAITVNQANTTQNNLAVHIGTDLTVGSATISFAADYNSVAPHWTFTAKLAEQVTFNFDDLLKAIHLDTMFSIPAELGLPTLTVQSLNGTMIPETRNFLLNGSVLIVPSEVPAAGTQADWSVPFLGLQFNMFGLSATVDFKNLSPEDPQNKNYFKATIGSFLDLNTLQVAVALQLGSAGTANIFTGSLSISQLQNLKIDQFGNGLVAGQDGATPENPFPDNNDWSKVTPNDMKLVEYASAYVYFNQSEKQFFLYGGIKDFGSAILLSQAISPQSTDRGYVFAFALSDTFKFANLFDGLTAIDNYLTIKNAGIAITTYTLDSADALVQQINGITDVLDKPGTISNPIKQGKLPAGNVPKGVHLYGQLQLTGPIFSLFTQLNSQGTQGLNVTLYAFFSTDATPEKGSATTIFKATFDEFSLLDNLITFKGSKDAPGIVMQYTQTDIAQFSLSGIISFNVFGTAYDFEGNLLVNSDQTAFSVKTAPATPIQLFPQSLPQAFVLTDLGLDVIYYFQTQQRPEKYLELNLTGKVELINTIFLDTNLYILKGNPVLAEITLTRDLSISQLAGNLVGNNQDKTNPAWPDQFFDIKFLANTENRHSRVYYYDAAADSNPSTYNGYLNGYNLEATVELTFVYTLTVLLKVNIQKNVGMVASVGLTQPINLFVLELASQQKSTTGNKKYINSPTLNLSTVTGSTTFGFSTGFNFFGYPFGKADVMIGKKDLGNNKSETKIQAKLTADEAVPLFGNLSVDFTYCQSEGFAVQNWPDFTQAYDSIQKIIDIADEVTGIMRIKDPKFGCGPITQLIAEVAYQNQFTMSPSFATQSDETGGYSLYMVLDGKFKVLVAGNVVTTIDFPNTIKILLPDGTSFDDLGGYIENAIKNSASSFVDGLLKNKEQWAKLAGILFAEKAAELASQWFCEKIVDSITADAFAAAGSAVTAAGGAAAIAAGGEAAAAVIIAGAGAVTSTFTSCFTAGTEVLLADGTRKNIENIQIGEVLKGHENSDNTVLAFDHPLLGTRKLYAFNEGSYFVTAEHPFLTEKGWKAIDPSATLKENPELTVGKLEAGDVLIQADGSKLELKSIQEKEADFNTQLYNFSLSGNNTYSANNLIAHNKGSSCFIAGTKVRMADGSEKAIEMVVIGDLLAGKDGNANEVLAFDHPLLGSRRLYSINGSAYFVTAEHPFMTMEGWKAIDPAATAEENPELIVGQLRVGDILLLADGKMEELKELNVSVALPETQLYNFALKGDHTYFANNYLVHNKGGGSGTDPEPETPTFTTAAITYSNGWLTANWNGASYAASYELEFYDPAGSKIGNTQSLGRNSLSGKTQISLNFNGGNYSAKVRSIRDSKQSSWASASIPKLPDPTEVALNYVPSTDDLSVVWNGASGVKFAVALYPVSAPDQGINIETTQSPYTRKGDGLQANVYEAKITAFSPTGNAVTSQAITSKNRLTKFSVIKNTAVQVTGKNLDISWDTNQEQGMEEILISIYQGTDSIFSTSCPILPAVKQIDSSGFPAGTLTIILSAAGNGTSTINGNTKTITGFSKLGVTITDPTLALNKAQEILVAAWSSVSGATGYSIVLSDENNNTVYTNTSVPADPQSLDIPLAEIKGTGTILSLNVAATGDLLNLNGDSVKSLSIIPRILAPATLRFSLQTGILKGEWDNVSGNEGYLAILLDNGSKLPPVNLSKDITTWDIEQSVVDEKAGPFTIVLATKADAETLDSRKSAPSPQISRLAVPQDVTLVNDFANVSLKANWQQLTGNNGYSIILLSNRSSVATEGLAKDITTCSIPYSQLGNATGPFTVKVNAIPADAAVLESLYSAPTAVSVIRYPTPESVVLSWDGENSQLSVNWTPYPAAAQLKVNIRNIETNAVVATQTVFATEVPVIFVEGDFTVLPNGHFHAELQALADTVYLESIVAISPDVQIVNLPAPGFAPLTVADGLQISGTISGIVLLAEGYQAQLIADGLPIGDIVEMVLPAGDNPTYSANFTVDQQTAGSAFNIQARATKLNFLPGDWGTAILPINRLAQVGLEPLVLAGNILTATISAEIVGTEFYIVQLLVAEVPYGNAFHMAKNSAGKFARTFTITEDQAGQNLQVSVQARGTGFIESIWKISDDSVQYNPVSTPDAPVLSVAMGNLNISWSDHNPANAIYEVQVYENENTTPLDTQPPVNYSGKSATININNLKTNTGYRATVRATVQKPGNITVISAWSGFSATVNTPSPGQPASLAIIRGNHQRVPRLNLTEIPGGTAIFDALAVQVTDINGLYVPGVPVTFVGGNRLMEMAIQIQPSGLYEPVPVLTDEKGMAVLNQMQGKSVYCYYAEGDFTINVSLNNLSQIFNLTVIPTPPLPSLKDAVLSIVSGDNQSLKATPDFYKVYAQFAPMTVRVTNSNGTPIPNALVSFTGVPEVEGMVVQVDPSGAQPPRVLTDANGMATLQKLYGNISALVYFRTGTFRVDANVNEGPTISFHGTVTE